MIGNAGAGPTGWTTRGVNVSKSVEGKKRSPGTQKGSKGKAESPLKEKGKKWPPERGAESVREYGRRAGGGHIPR